MVYGFAAGTVALKTWTFRKWLITKTRANINRKDKIISVKKKFLQLIS